MTLRRTAYLLTGRLRRGAYARGRVQVAYRLGRVACWLACGPCPCPHCHPTDLRGADPHTTAAPRPQPVNQPVNSTGGAR